MFYQSKRFVGHSIPITDKTFGPNDSFRQVVGVYATARVRFVCTELLHHLVEVFAYNVACFVVLIFEELRNNLFIAYAGIEHTLGANVRTKLIKACVVCIFPKSLVEEVVCTRILEVTHVFKQGVVGVVGIHIVVVVYCVRPYVEVTAKTRPTLYHVGISSVFRFIEGVHVVCRRCAVEELRARRANKVNRVALFI